MALNNTVSQHDTGRGVSLGSWREDAFLLRYPANVLGDRCRLLRSLPVAGLKIRKDRIRSDYAADTSVAALSVDRLTENRFAL